MSNASAVPDPDVASPSSDPPVSSERLGPYELLIELASGGMATVHLARAADRRTGPPLVALKKPHRHLTSDKTFLTMLVDEARLASAINHPNVVKVRELGFDRGVPYIVMEYVEGVSLAELRRELSAIGRALDVRLAVRIVLDALAGLHAAHELCDESGKPLHIIHRDVSPHNVLIGCDGRAHLTDFGIAQAEDRIQTTRTYEVKGKLAYLAPERVDKRRLCTVQSDVFSMAVVLWECFAGRRLFRGDEAVDVLQEVMNGEIPRLTQIGAHVPPALDDVVMRALSRELEVRYATARELAEAIEEAAGPDQIGTYADVARLMEAMFGARMAARQDQVRAAIGSSDLDDLLRESGLPTRERVTTADAPAPHLLAELAPPAPTARYAVGTDLRRRSPRPRMRRLGWLLGAAAGGVAVGAAVTLALVSRSSKSLSASPARAWPPAAHALQEGSPTTRKIIVRLPFAATQLTLDDVVHALERPSDVAVIDLPGESDVHHRVTAIAVDGTRADGYVHEQEGVASVDSEGYALIPPPEQAAPEFHHDSPVTSPRRSRSLGTVHDGFTKLR